MRRGNLDAVLTLDAAILDAIVAHARRDHPDEACGIVAGPAGSDVPSRYIQMDNAERSSTFYSFDSVEWLRVWREMDDRDEEAVVIYHSHTATEAYPSRTDIALASVPEAHYLLVSTREPDSTEVRSFRIVDGAVTEEPVEVVNSSVDPHAAPPESGRLTADSASLRPPASDVQSYMFGQSPTAVDYECRAGS
jgi:proteasome lid subunit RPN8/RPN11